MNIKKLSILFCFVLMAIVASAMKYQIKVLNTPRITINNKEMKVGDWFDDQAVIAWSKESQAMRVLSEDNRVYTLSAKLCKEIKVKTFADFILYTKPLAARGNYSQTLIEALEEKFDNYFIMLDEIVVDLSDIELPENFSIYFTLKENEKHYGKFIVSNSKVILKRNQFEKFDLVKNGILSICVYMRMGLDKTLLITNNTEIDFLPILLN